MLCLNNNNNGDYRAIKSVTEPDRYLLPHFQDSAAFRRGKTIFSNINLVRVHDRISLADEDIAKAAKFLLAPLLA